VFIGEFSHSIDHKGRIAIPAKFRANLATGCVVTRGLDNSLSIYPATEWEKMARKWAALPIYSADARAFSRLMLSGAMDLEIDKQGRVVIPPYLREYAGLKNEAIICGVYNRLEIWAKDKWEEYRTDTEDKAVSIAEELQDREEKA
jgi:MraZ protein